MSRRKYPEHTYTRNISASEVPIGIKSQSSNSLNSNYSYNKHKRKYRKITIDIPADKIPAEILRKAHYNHKYCIMDIASEYEITIK